MQPGSGPSVQAVLKVGGSFDDLVERRRITKDHDAHRVVILAKIIDDANFRALREGWSACARKVERWAIEEHAGVGNAVFVKN